tara:strand:- start:138 stop:323 length:186 start_codon:yes stop_codon:yes gene_type:complete
MADLEHQASAGMTESGEWQVMILLTGFSDEADARAFEKEYNSCGNIFFETLTFSQDQGLDQ